MQTINVKGVGPVQFPDDMTREQIAEAISRNAPAPQQAKPPVEDVYKRDAQERYEKTKDLPKADAARLWLQGATLGAADEVIAGALTPIEMIRNRTLSPVEGYKYAKAYEDLALEKARERSGVLGAVAEGVGGVGPGAGLIRAVGSRIAPAAFAPGAGRAVQYGQNVVGGTGLGALSGGLDAKDGDRAQGAITGGLLGGGLSAVAPIAMYPFQKAGHALWSYLKPQSAAEAQFVNAMLEARQTPAALQSSLQRAVAEGQGSVYTPADALGKAGREKLTVVTKSPGPGRTDAEEFLVNRQLGAGRRTTSAVQEGFNAPVTADAARARAVQFRNDQAGVNYGRARADVAGPVNLTPAIDLADNYLAPGVNRVISQGAMPENTVTRAVENARSLLSDGRVQISDFGRAFNAKRDLDSMIGAATTSNAQREQLKPIRDAIDDALAKASPTYSAARDTYRRQSNEIRALGLDPDSPAHVGAKAHSGGRVEDTIPAFNALTPGEQQAARIGYSDRIIRQIQDTPGNKARFVETDWGRAELPAFAAPGRGDRMMSRLQRENEMHKTMNRALGGSPTFENMANDAGAREAIDFAANVATGNHVGAVRQIVGQFSSGLSGAPAAMREHLGRLLLSPAGSSIPIDEIYRRQLMNDIAAQQRRNAYLAGGLLATQQGLQQ